MTLAASAPRPPGGLRLRLRAPVGCTGKMSSVTVGGKAWTRFTPADETVDFAANDLTAALVGTGLPDVVVGFA